MGLDGTNVSTRDHAYTALTTLDNAIDYALNNQTRMGAYQTKLSYTVGNLTTSSENTQAREMTGYTKANILSQSAQAMLAQANQNASSVLQLLG